MRNQADHGLTVLLSENFHVFQVTSVVKILYKIFLKKITFRVLQVLIPVLLPRFSGKRVL